jgi:hypothetical protein
LKVKILVATHKKYEFPKDPIYIPIQVGKSINTDLGYIGDNTGDNISEKNPNFCELTALYWAWKNLDVEYIGLVHYRRYFGKKTVWGSIDKKKEDILNSNQLKRLLFKYDAILPKKRRYWIETNFSHYAHAHHKEDLIKAKEIILNKYPDYIPSFDIVMNRTYSHRFNMLIMKKDILDQYCQWLFDILFELENIIDISNYSKTQARVFGYISERLLDVWLEVNKVNYKELPVLFIEKQNWVKKGFAFIQRKFLND